MVIRHAGERDAELLRVRPVDLHARAGLPHLRENTSFGGPYCGRQRVNPPLKRAQSVRRCEAARGATDQATAAALGVRRETEALWRRRVREQGIGCVWEIAAGRGRKPNYDAARVAQLVEATLQTKPAGATHWSTRTLARAHGVSKNTIHRIWQDHGLKPHLTKSFKLSSEPKFLEKLTDLVGVYLAPPQNAVVLCVDE